MISRDVNEITLSTFPLSLLKEKEHLHSDDRKTCYTRIAFFFSLSTFVMSKLRGIQASLLSNHRLKYSSIHDGLCYAKQKFLYSKKYGRKSLKTFIPPYSIAMNYLFTKRSHLKLTNLNFE